MERRGETMRWIVGAVLILCLMTPGCQWRAPQELDTRLLYAGLTAGAVEPVLDRGPRIPGDIRDLPNCGGTPFPVPARGPFATQENRLLAKEAQGEIQLYDQVVPGRRELKAEVVVTYGEEPLREDWLRVFVGSCSGWGQVAEVRTDKEGRAQLALRQRLSPGVYGLAIQVVGDATAARAELWILPEATKLKEIALTAAKLEAGGSAKQAGQVEDLVYEPGVLLVYLDQEGLMKESSLGALRSRLRREGFPVGPILGGLERSRLESLGLLEQTERRSSDMIPWPNP